MAVWPTLRCTVVAVACACACSVSAAAAAPKKKLPREELVALFAGLSNAAKAAKTFNSPMKRSDKSVYVIDDAPIVAEGTVWIERPSRFRQDIAKPRESVTVVSESDLWVYFPASAEAQHIDLRKGLKGRSDTTSESIMPWLTFDLAGLEQKYKVSAKPADVPEGITVTICPRVADGESPPNIADLPAQKPERCYRIDFVPKDPKSAPGMASLSIWVDGVNPWPLRIERESVDGDLQVTEFARIVLEGPIDPRLFEYRPPKGTRVVQLSD